MSKSAGLPDWWTLLSEPRARANVPEALTDAPLAAEYIAASTAVGEVALRSQVLDQLADADPGNISQSHRLLADLPVTEFWTTNYDQLIERACPHAQVIVHDHQVRDISATVPTIVKLHGSLAVEPDRRWVAPPILTRGEFERYEDEHPRMWALLRASYVSRTMLFLGFSFLDPNVEILQRLARRHGTHIGDRHLTVMRKPPEKSADDPDGVQRRLHDLRVADLERSGVRVCEIHEFDELPSILQALVRRTRPPRIFISGSAPEDDLEQASLFAHWCERIAAALADTEWELSSLGGPAGWQVTRAVAHAKVAESRYNPDELVLHFRSKDGPTPHLEERLGTAKYSNMDRTSLLHHVMKDCRALLAIRGGEKTLEELRMAAGAGLSVIPLAASGGAARAFWMDHRQDPPLIGGQSPATQTWEQLDDREPVVALRAALQLLRQGMYELS